MSPRKSSRHFVVLAGLALIASASSCDSLPEDGLETQASLTSQSCQQGLVPAGMFQVGPCPLDAIFRKMCTCFPRSPSNPEQIVSWSTPDLMVDKDGNGIIDLQGPSNASAKSILLNLDSCSSQRAPTNKWVVTNDSGFSATASAGSACTATVGLPDRGIYHVQLTATYDNQVKVTTRDITMTNYVVVSVGDSLASGEGAPDVAGTPYNYQTKAPQVPAKWESASCHRSAKSGPAQAALALERGDKNSNVTFISKACTGAGEFKGLRTPYQGLTAQIAAVAQALCPSFTLPANGDISSFTNPVKNQCRPIDALIINVGANDLGFGAIARGCSAPGKACQDTNVKDPITGLTQGLPAVVDFGVMSLTNRFAVLKNTINNMLRVNDVFFAEYHDFFADQTGKLCTQMVLPNAVDDQRSNTQGFFDEALTIFTLGFVDYPSDGLIDSREVPFLRDKVFIPLNNQLKTISKSHGWNWISGIADEFVTHGYCSTSPWVVKYEVSKATQLDPYGTFHPNEAGHQVYKRHILQSLLRRLPNAPTSGRKVLADMNGDGRSDLPISGGTTPGGATWGSIPTGLSRPDGFFDVVNKQFTGGDTQVPLYATQRGARPILGDFNGDGKGDVAFTGGAGWGSIPVAFSNGDGTYSGLNGPMASGSVPFASITSSVGAQPLGGDFDGDGKSDIAVWGTGVGEIAIASLNSNGTWRTTNRGVSSGINLTQHTIGKNARMVAGDFNGDGKSDIAIVSPFTAPEKVSVAFSNGDGSFRGTVGGVASGTERAFVQRLASGEQELVAGDFNGDGKTDLAVVGGKGLPSGIVVALSQGDGAFRNMSMFFEFTDTFFVEFASTHGVKPAVGDFNGDGVDDIALTGGTGWTSIPIAYSTGNHTFMHLLRSVISGDVDFTTYASHRGASPSAFYPLNHVVKESETFLDNTTSCNVGGTWMHCCPTGSAMVGVDLARDVFKCAPLANTTGTRSLDLGTARNFMHACPMGQVMVGLHLALNRLACQTVPGLYTPTFEGTDTGSIDINGIHVCNDVAFGAMSGIHADQNHYTCTTGN